MGIALPQLAPASEDRVSGALVVDGSLNLESVTKNYLKRTPGPNGSRRKWTWSAWVKRNKIGYNCFLFGAGSGFMVGGAHTAIMFQSTDQFQVYDYTGSGYSYNRVTTKRFRDFSAWYHIVVAFDSTVATEIDRLRIFVNGEQQTSFGTNAAVSLNHETYLNDDLNHQMGVDTADSVNAKMSNVYFIDGQALGGGFFGYNDPLTGTWRPKKFKPEGTTVNDGRVFSSTGTFSNWDDDGSYPRTELFDGTLYTGGTPNGACPDDGNPATFDFGTQRITGFQNLRVNIFLSSNQVNAKNLVSVNGEDITDACHEAGNNTWTQVDLGDRFTTLQSFSVANNNIYVGGFIIDGVIVKNSTTENLEFGTNGFYLPMDGNSPIGSDQAPSVNDGTVWSNFSTASNITAGNMAGFFQGDTSSCSSLSLGTSGVFLLTKDIPNVRKIGVHSNTGASYTMKVNEGLSDAYTVTVPSQNNVSILDEFTGFTGTIHTLSFSGFGAGVCLNAIEINGDLLIDGITTKGNDWRQRNIGGSAGLDKATGAFPILTAGNGGNVAGPGVFNSGVSKYYTVTVAPVDNQNKYYLDGVLSATPTLHRGGSYTFDYTSDATHPFFLSSLPNGKHNSKAYSVLFDGSGDYLSVPSSSDLDFGSGDCTVECFVYITSHGADKTVIGSWEGTTSWQLSYGADSGNDRFAFMMHDGSSTLAAISSIQSTNYVNQWVHLAGVRHGNWLRVYINGVFGGERSITGAHTAINAPVTIGGRSNGNQVTGYISNVRVVKGTALYTAAFEPPNTTLTNVSGTTLLCCQQTPETAAEVTPGTITKAGNAAADQGRQPFLYDSNHGDFGINTATSNVTKVTIPHNAPDSLYYYCSSHSNMGNLTTAMPVVTDLQKADPYAWKLVNALPLVGNPFDVSSSLNVNTSTNSVTANGPVFSDDESNFYGGSYYFDGNNDKLTVADSTDLQFGTGDFTFETWIYPSDISNYKNFYEGNTTGGLQALRVQIKSTGIIEYVIGSNVRSLSEQTIVTNEWHHVALTRKSGTVRVFVNGRLEETVTDSSNLTSNKLQIGETHDGYNYAGYIQDHRVYKGVAKYTESFVPASTKPDIFPDSPSGVPTKTKLTPITSGSVDFDGVSGTDMQIANHADIQIGSTSNWTIEFFMYRTEASFQDYDVIIGKGSGGGTYEWFIEGFGDTSVDFMYSADGNTTWSGTHEIMSNMAQNRWYHIAIVRNGSGANNFKMYVDGKQTFQTTAFDIHAGNANLHIGGYGGAAAQDPAVLISNFRIVKGTSVYTTEFTPPTEPLTNITNTKLLCCQSKVNPGNVAVGPLVSGVNDGTQWSSSLATGKNPGSVFRSGFPAKYAFNGTTKSSTNDCAATPQTAGQGFEFTFGEGVPFTTLQMQCDPNGGGLIQVNGVDVTSQLSNGSLTNTTITGVSSPLTSLRIYSHNGDAAYLGSITIDGTMLVDPINSINGGVEATSISPFSTNINSALGPKGNYATLNPIKKTPNHTVSEGNLRVGPQGNQWGAVASTFGMTNGKYYFEAYPFTSDYTYAGIANAESNCFDHNGGYVGGTPNDWGYLSSSGDLVHNTASTYTTGTVVNNGDTLGVAFDADNKEGRWYHNGVLVYKEKLTGDYPFYFGTGSYNSSHRVNFGQKPFRFPVEGYQALTSSAERPDNVVSRGNKYVAPMAYVGLQQNIGDTRTITTNNADFKPDLVWVKSRTTTEGLYLYDSVRGDGTGNKRLRSDGTAGQSTYNPGVSHDLNGFVKGGFTMNGVNGHINGNSSSDTYVAWMWKAGGRNNTYNIDDVGYANASDVNMSVGSLNSSAYNTSQHWSNSNNTSGNVNTSGNYTPANMFNGILGNESVSNAVCFSTYASNASMIWTSPVSLTNLTSLRLWVDKSGSNTGFLRVNGTDYSSIVTSSDFTDGWVEIPETYLATIQFGYTGGTNTATGIAGVEVNGQLLIDSTITPANIPSIAATGSSVGTRQGFSIVQYTGSGSTGTLAHGLDQTPDFVICKNLSTSYNWFIWHRELGNGANTGLYFTGATPTTNFGTQPFVSFTPHTITFNNNDGVNGSHDYVCYSWHNVPGLQKFGSYSGDGGADGPYINCGFRPSIVWCKIISGGTDNWAVQDTARAQINTYDSTIRLNDNAAEVVNSGNYNFDFTSNGFKIRNTNGEYNGGVNWKYIYCAWGEEAAHNLFGAQSSAY